MKNLAFTLIALLNVAALTSALAAPQDPAIAAAQKTPTAQAAPDQTAQATPPVKALPLDHGPRAEVTPWVNQQHRLQAQQEAQLAAAHHDSDKHASNN
ncbi:MAG TPA: hypothetical protein VGP06_18515 [Janthinobacterium sp.]|jgi:hypothetical protein|nr:hypothetical protein [Janthinobacterium sp.]